MKLSTVSILVALAAVPFFGQSGQTNSGKGQTIFQEQCAGCHGPDGRAQTEMGKSMQAADLTSSAVQQQSDAELEKFVKGGKGKMPSFDQKLSGGDIHAVVAYIRQMGKAR